jgi:DNA polymerase-3 subunit beta
MKITLLQENLNKALSIASHFVSSHPQLPILTNFSLKTAKNRLMISATNLEIGINYYCGAKIEEEGGVAVNAKTLADFVASLPAENIDLVSQKENLKITCGHYQASLPGGSLADFPKVPTKTDQKIAFNFSNLVTAVKKVIFAAANDDSRPVLSGINFKINKKNCLLTATDGYRLSFEKIKLDQEYQPIEFIIPTTILTEIIRLKLEDENAILELGLANEEKQVVLFLPNLEFSSRLLAGDFPDVGKIVPQEKATTILVDREEFLGVVRTAAIFAREATNTIRLEITDGKIKILANAPDLGENSSQIEAKQEGDNQKVAFNYRFLIDLLTNLESEQVIMEMEESLRPVVFKDPRDKDFLHIIMPVNLQED